MVGVVGYGWLLGALGRSWLVVGFQRLVVSSLFLCAADCLNCSGWLGWLGWFTYQPTYNTLIINIYIVLVGWLDGWTLKYTIL